MLYPCLYCFAVWDAYKGAQGKIGKVGIKTITAYSYCTKDLLNNSVVIAWRSF
jgi:hypothetical protein